MDNRWPQRATFKQIFNDYKDANRIGSKQAAEDLGSTVGTVNQYLYRMDTKPSLEWLQNAARVLGCSVTVFIDDPGTNLTQLDLSSFSEVDRYRIDRIIRSILEPDLDDEDRQWIFEDFVRSVERRRLDKSKFNQKANASPIQGK